MALHDIHRSTRPAAKTDTELTAVAADDAFALADRDGRSGEARQLLSEARKLAGDDWPDQAETVAQRLLR